MRCTTTSVAILYSYVYVTSRFLQGENIHLFQRGLCESVSYNLASILTFWSNVYSRLKFHISVTSTKLVEFMCLEKINYTV